MFRNTQPGNLPVNCLCPESLLNLTDCHISGSKQYGNRSHTGYAPEYRTDNHSHHNINHCRYASDNDIPALDPEQRKRAVKVPIDLAPQSPMKFFSTRAAMMQNIIPPHHPSALFADC